MQITFHLGPLTKVMNTKYWHPRLSLDFHTHVHPCAEAQVHMCTHVHALMNIYVLKIHYKKLDDVLSIPKV